MVSINFANREVSCKIVYYGPGMSGKTTNLQYVHDKVPSGSKGQLISLATETDRTLYFDFLPLNIGTINGMATKFQLYTVPGQVFYNATRKLVLRGVDGIVFVADSQTSKREENIESLGNLKDNLDEYGYDINTLPIVLQYNKRDLPETLSLEELQADLNPPGWPYSEATATFGEGVFDTLKMITKIVLAQAAQGAAAKEENSVDHDAIASMARRPATTVQAAAVVAAPVVETPTTAAESGPAIREAVATAPPPEPALPVNRKVDPALPVEYWEGGNRQQTAASDYTDAFEVPRVIAMQKSLRVRKSKKKKLSLFGWFRFFARKKA